MYYCITTQCKISINHNPVISSKNKSDGLPMIQQIQHILRVELTRARINFPDKEM